MNPEKEIVNIWLRNNGFFTVNNLNAGTQVIDILAIKVKGKSLEKVQHIEVIGTISKLSEKTSSEIEKRFNSRCVVETVREFLRKTTGAESEYEKIAVLTSPAIKLKDISIYRMEDIISDVIAEIDTQNYRHTVTRCLQLVKYVLLSSPEHLARLISAETNILTLPQRERLVAELVKDRGIRQILSKRRFENEIADILKRSTLNRTERLADVLVGEIVPARNQKRFLEHLIQKSKAGKSVRRKKAKEKSLASFIK